MASARIQALKTTFKRKNRFDSGIGAQLPEAYRKFWTEWKKMKPAAVHFIPQEGTWKRNELTGEIFPVQNVPLPLKYPKELHDGIWGGEAVIKGFQKRNPNKRRVPHFWVPVLKRTVVHSKVLDTYLSVVVTERTITLIHDHYGFDHYLLKTPACDLVSELALKLKKKILTALLHGCPSLSYNNIKQKEVYDEYKEYLSAYTPEEIEWYGLNFTEACKKLKDLQELANAPQPLKEVYRKNLLEKLKAAGIKEADVTQSDELSTSSWLSKINPFKKNEA